MSISQLKERAQRMAEAKKKREKSKVKTWRDFVHAANTIGAMYKQHLFNKPQWRRKCL